MNNLRQMMTQGDRDAILNSDSSTMEKLSKLVSAAKLKDNTEVQLKYYTETKDSKVGNVSTQTESRIDTIELLRRLNSIKEYVSELERMILA